MKPIVTSIAAIGAALLLAASAAMAAAPSAHDLTRAAAIDSVSLSPDGKHLVALSSPDGQVEDIVVWRTDALSAAPTRIRATHMRFTSVQFLKNDRLLVSAVQPVTMGAQINLRQNYITDLDGKSFSPLLPGEDVDHPQFSGLVSTLPMDPRHILVEGPGGDIYSVDTYSLTAGRVMNGSDKYFGYKVDLKGVLRSREYADFDGGKVFIAQQLRDPDSGQWVELFRSYAKDRVTTDIVGFTTDPHVILIATPQGGDKEGVYAYDVRQRKIIEQEFGHKLFDVGGGLFPVHVYQSHDKTDFGAVLGFTLLDYAYHAYWTDPSMQAMAASVQSALGERSTQTNWTDPGSGLTTKVAVPDGSFADLVSWSDDRHYVLVEKSGPKQPPEYYLLTSGKLELLGKARPWIDTSALGDTKLVEYRARDGLMIPAFLTLPPAAQFGPGPYPTLVEPHGGPWARDFMDWDAAGWVQYFASRGYAVIEPQFRGSQGWGQKLWRAGDSEWGQKMADDLDDAVKWLIDQHVADPKRVAMFGYSYGGYAALAASIRPNGLYQCTISGAGAGDLSAIAYATADNRWEREFQHPFIGGLDALKHATEAQVPVLLYHGDRDDTVDPEQSRKFAAALRGARKPVKLVEIKDMGHQYDLMTPAMMEEQLDIIDAFLKSDCKPGGL